MVSVVLPLAFAMLVVVLETLVVVEAVIANKVVVAVVSVAVIGDAVVVLVELGIVLSVFGAGVGVVG